MSSPNKYDYLHVCANACACGVCLLPSPFKNCLQTFRFPAYPAHKHTHRFRLVQLCRHGRRRRRVHQQHDVQPEQPVLVHQSGGEEAARLEAGRRGGEVGREGRRQSGEEAEEAQGRHRGAGAGAVVSRPAVQVCDDTALAGRTVTGELEKYCCKIQLYILVLLHPGSRRSPIARVCRTSSTVACGAGPICSRTTN